MPFSHHHHTDPYTTHNHEQADDPSTTTTTSTPSLDKLPIVVPSYPTCPYKEIIREDQVDEWVGARALEFAFTRHGERRSAAASAAVKRVSTSTSTATATTHLPHLDPTLTLPHHHHHHPIDPYQTLHSALASHDVPPSPSQQEIETLGAAAAAAAAAAGSTPNNNTTDTIHIHSLSPAPAPPQPVSAQPTPPPSSPPPTNANANANTTPPPSGRPIPRTHRPTAAPQYTSIIEYRCCWSGSYRPRAYENKTGQTRQRAPSIKVGCKAKFVIRKVAKTGQVCVTYHWLHNGHDPTDIEQIKRMRSAQLPESIKTYLRGRQQVEAAIVAAAGVAQAEVVEASKRGVGKRDREGAFGGAAADDDDDDDDALAASPTTRSSGKRRKRAEEEFVDVDEGSVSAGGAGAGEAGPAAGGDLSRRPTMSTEEDRLMMLVDPRLSGITPIHAVYPHTGQQQQHHHHHRVSGNAGAPQSSASSSSIFTAASLPRPTPADEHDQSTTHQQNGFQTQTQDDQHHHHHQQLLALIPAPFIGTPPPPHPQDHQEATTVVLVDSEFMPPPQVESTDSVLFTSTAAAARRWQQQQHQQQAGQAQPLSDLRTPTTTTTAMGTDQIVLPETTMHMETGPIPGPSTFTSTEEVSFPVLPPQADDTQPSTTHTTPSSTTTTTTTLTEFQQGVNRTLLGLHALVEELQQFSPHMPLIASDACPDLGGGGGGDGDGGQGETRASTTDEQVRETMRLGEEFVRRVARITRDLRGAERRGGEEGVVEGLDPARVDGAE